MTLQAAISQTDLEVRLRFETMLADLSSRFVNLPPAEVDREIEDAQRRVCECLGLDLALEDGAPRARPAAAPGRTIVLVTIYRPYRGASD